MIAEKRHRKDAIGIERIERAGGSPSRGCSTSGRRLPYDHSWRRFERYAATRRGDETQVFARPPSHRRLCRTQDARQVDDDGER